MTTQLVTGFALSNGLPIPLSTSITDGSDSEELKTKPFGAVWDYYCLVNNVAVSEDYIAEIQQYESEVLVKRS